MLYRDFNELTTLKRGLRSKLYVEKRHFYYCINFGISHVLGEHVEFEIKYKDIVNNIKAENEVWNDFSSR